MHFLNQCRTVSTTKVSHKLLANMERTRAHMSQPLRWGCAICGASSLSSLTAVSPGAKVTVRVRQQHVTSGLLVGA
jgi:hypothetical protein